MKTRPPVHPHSQRNPATPSVPIHPAGPAGSPTAAMTTHMPETAARFRPETGTPASRKSAAGPTDIAPPLPSSTLENSPSLYRPDHVVQRGRFEHRLPHRLRDVVAVIQKRLRIQSLHLHGNLRRR